MNQIFKGSLLTLLCGSLLLVGVTTKAFAYEEEHELSSVTLTAGEGHTEFDHSANLYASDSLELLTPPDPVNGVDTCTEELSEHYLSGDTPPILFNTSNFDLPSMFDEVVNTGDFPRIVTKTQRTCLTITECLKRCYVYRVRALVWQCGEALCIQIIEIEQRRGLFEWRPIRIPGGFDTPIQVYPPTDTGWICTETVDPSGDGEVRTCINLNTGVVCVSQRFITVCVFRNSPVDVPENLPPLGPGYGDIPEVPEL